MPGYYLIHDNKIKQNKYKQERVVKKLTALNSENVRNPVLPDIPVGKPLEMILKMCPHR